MKKAFDIHDLDKAFVSASFNPPEGYIDAVKKEVLAQLPPVTAMPEPQVPVQTARRTHFALRIITSAAVAAACVAVALVWPSSSSPGTGATNTENAHTVATQYDANDKYIDDLYNYAMLGDYDLYAYLSNDY